MGTPYALASQRWAAASVAVVHHCTCSALLHETAQNPGQHEQTPGTASWWSGRAEALLRRLIPLCSYHGRDVVCHPPLQQLPQQPSIISTTAAATAAVAAATPTASASTRCCPRPSCRSPRIPALGRSRAGYSPPGCAAALPLRACCRRRRRRRLPRGPHLRSPVARRPHGAQVLQGGPGQPPHVHHGALGVAEQLSAWARQETGRVT